MDYVQYKRICCAIESALKSGKKKFIIYPYGMNGMFCKIILNERYGIDEWYIVDNNLCKFRKNVKKIVEIPQIDKSEVAVLFTVENPEVYTELWEEITSIYSEDVIFQIFPPPQDTTIQNTQLAITKIGKYTSGPLARQDPIIESIGAFCSFAVGTDVVVNHSVDYISTHTFMHYGNSLSETQTSPLLDITRAKRQLGTFLGYCRKESDIVNAESLSVMMCGSEET